MKREAFSLIELMVVATIIVVMALVAIPNFNKHQKLIEIQNKGDEIRASMEGMQMKALNAEQGKTRYYAKTTGVVGVAYTQKIEYGSYNGIDEMVYKTINLPTDLEIWINGAYFVCDKGKSYCCSVNSIDASCSEPADLKSEQTIGLLETTDQNNPMFIAFHEKFSPFRIINEFVIGTSH